MITEPGRNGEWVYTNTVGGTTYVHQGWWLVSPEGCPAGPHSQGICANCFAIDGPCDAPGDASRGYVDAECLYCYNPVGTLDVPASWDDEMWEALAEEHDPDCEWIATRAHQSLIVEGICMASMVGIECEECAEVAE